MTRKKDIFFFIIFVLKILSDETPNIFKYKVIKKPSSQLLKKT